MSDDIMGRAVFKGIVWPNAREMIARLSNLPVRPVVRYAPVSVSAANKSDPDGPPVPLPSREPVAKAIEAQGHDFIGALYRPYEPVA